MKILVALVSSLLFVSLCFAEGKAPESKPASKEFENRCGWVENPTPANWWLTDKDGEWIIGEQGGHQAEGDIPEFPDNKTFWKKTNGGYGYGCACFEVKVDKKKKTVLEIKSGKVLPLSKCRADASLKSRNR